ncbi:hypothetical protein [Fischerella thermalis]|uniref:hypothetical protein n=1 Tax=Fischerella thermalis TaxID=372787 RepID=UPI00155898FA|nr:hypothetical protein [Fischerella thermalis]
MPAVRKEIEENIRLREERIKDWSMKYLNINPEIPDYDHFLLIDDKKITWEVAMDS